MRSWKTWVLAALGVSIVSFAAVRAQQGGAKGTTGIRPLSGQDYAEIQQLLNKYMFALDFCDQGKPYNYADLYTPDGAFMAGHGSDRPNLEVKGREALSRFGQRPDGSCSPSGVRGLQNDFHFNIGPVIEASPEGARGKSYLLMMHTPTGQVRYAGWYEDVYAKTPAGWRFKSRNHRTDYSILYDTRVPGFDREPGARDLGPGAAAGRGQGK